ncbi:MAG TPA: carbamoyltransferase HypF [Thermoleophilaceae bacterium]
MSTAAPAVGRRHVRARVEGTVQGVGFRPFVYRLALELGLSGHVFNDAHGVVVEAQADARAVEAFLERLAAEAPPLATVERVTVRELPLSALSAFQIRASPAAGQPSALVSPDTATCDDCLAELFDPHDRRYRYAFINCTNCGPRFTIVRGVPYDRPLTTMAGFEMCEACRAEYEDPADRRFHAQPNACPDCGPRLSLPLERVVEALRAGAVVAVKGVGGFHLACLASDEGAVATLRSRKHREDKPFALMVRDVAAARELVEPAPEDESLLLSRARPIVLMRRRAGAPVARSVAPISPDLGLMLPYSPLHHLLLADVDAPLVMTSGNVSDEPIAFRDDEALERLAGVADVFLLHDRLIETRTDDSVVRTVSVNGARRPLLLRRSRGHVPASIGLPVHTPRHVLACGAELKNTFCVAKDGRSWVGHHVGDLRNYETLRSFTDGIEHFKQLFAVEPELVACDLHPDYLSTKYARELDGVELVGVQHHHAHLAACLAEHGASGPALGAIYDGTGHGSDGTVWGGELLYGDLTGFERVGHLFPVRMPGGEAAIRQPWRMACAWLVAADEREPQLPANLAGRVSPESWEQVTALVLSGLASPVTTSAGRLFDAAAALCGVRAEVNYEGQAAIEFEAACDHTEQRAYPLPFTRGVLDARHTIVALMDDLAAGTPVPLVAARFHNALARATADACAGRADLVVLSGGVFQNRRLLEGVACRLGAAGVRVLTPERLPPNDGGIAYGQAAAAAARSA